MKKLVLVIAGILSALLLFFSLKGIEFYKKIYTPNLFKQNEVKTTYNILLFGYGGIDNKGRVHEGTYLTDTIMFLHIDLKNKTAALFSIPRDLWVKLPTKSKDPFHLKINSVYQLESGGIGDISRMFPDLDQSHFGQKNDAEYTKYIMSQVLGVPIDNYVAADFEGFKKAIDVLGGVDVNVIKTFDDPQYPIDGKEKDLCGNDEQFDLIKDYINNPNSDQEHLKQLFKDHKNDDPTKDLETFYTNISDSPEKAFPCRYENLHFTKGIIHMDGETALKYVRSRHSLQDGSDFGRSARQQRLIQSVKEKVLDIGFVPKIIPLLDELGNHIRTDFSIEDIKKFVSIAATANNYNVTMFVLSDQNLLENNWSNDRQFILTSKEGIDRWDTFHVAIKNIFDGITPTPEPSKSENTPSDLQGKPTATPSGTLK